jgi:uncharacterized protein YqgC (DUF456 family)
VNDILAFLGWVGFGLGLLGGLLLIPLGLGGTFVILGVGLALGFATHFARVEWQALAVLAILAVIGEIAESLIGLFTVRRFGASKWAMLGTFLGGIAGGAAGTGLMPVVGSLVGAFAGAFIGAFVGELAYRRRAPESLRAGWGAFLGRVLAVAIKFEIGVVMVVILVWRVVRNG